MSFTIAVGATTDEFVPFSGVLENVYGVFVTLVTLDEPRVSSWYSRATPRASAVTRSSP